MLLGAVMISFSGVWVNVCHVSATVSAFYRVLFGGLFLLVAGLINRELKWLGLRYLVLGIFCGLFFAIDLTCYHYSIRYVGPGLGTILPNFQVFILAAAGALFLREHLRAAALFSMPVAVAGLFMIVGLDWHELSRPYQIGIYFGLAAAVFYSAFLLSLRKLQSSQRGRSIYQVLMAISFIAAVFVGGEVLRIGDSFRIPDWQSFWSLSVLGLFSQAAGWVLIANALPHIRAALSGLILLLQPALAFIWDVLFFHRPTSMQNWIGVMIVLTAIYMGAARSNHPLGRHRRNRSCGKSPG